MSECLTIVMEDPTETVIYYATTFSSSATDDYFFWYAKNEDGKTTATYAFPRNRVTRWSKETKEAEECL